MRRLSRPVPVRIAGGRPVAFAWGGRWRRIDECLEAWRETGAWWESDLPRDCLRVLAEGRVFELCGEADGRWVVVCVYD